MWTTRGFLCSSFGVVTILTHPVSIVLFIAMVTFSYNFAMFLIGFIFLCFMGFWFYVRERAIPISMPPFFHFSIRIVIIWMVWIDSWIWAPFAWNDVILNLLNYVIEISLLIREKVDIAFWYFISIYKLILSVFLGLIILISIDKHKEVFIIVVFMRLLVTRG